MKTILKTAFILNVSFTFFSLSFGGGWGEAYAQNIGINGNGNTAHSSALLDVDAVATPSLGVLIPRIALQAINLAAPVTSPATSLLLYNTATASTGTNAVSPGYYYWDGAKWVRFQMANAGSNSTAWDVLGNTGTNPTTNFLGTTDNVALVFRVNNSEQMRIQPSGVLLNTIGLTLGNIIGSDLQGVNNNSILWGINATGYVAGFYNNNNVAQSNGVVIKTANTASNTTILDLSTGSHSVAGTSVMSVKGNGNVGIGTTTPNNKLEITQGSAGNSGLRFTNLPNAAILKTDANGDVIPSTASTATNNGVFWGLNGNAGTVAGTNFLGTIDNVDLVFKRNNFQSGLISGNNTSFGFRALNVSTTGLNNTAIGANALLVNTNSSGNTAIGSNCLGANTTGNGNTAIGNSCLANNINGFWNVAIGELNMQQNTAGNENTSIGHGTFNNNLTGNQNVAIGKSTLTSNTGGSRNSGSGYQSLNQNTTGYGNTASGFNALQNNTTGGENVGLGINTGITNTTGNFNVYVGSGADATVNNLTKAVAIGYNAKVGASNAMVLGGTGVNAVNVGIGTTTPNNKLEITQGSAGNSGLRFTNLPNAGVLSTNANGDVVPATATTATNNGVFWGLNGNSGTSPSTNFIGTTDNVPVVFKSNNIEKMRLETSGVLRNGESLSLASLIGADLNGLNLNSMFWAINLTGYVAGFYNKNNAVSSNGLMVKTASSDVNSTILDLSTGSHSVAGTTVMSVKGNGNVGIGTTTPSAKLHILGTPTNTTGSQIITSLDYTADLLPNSNYVGTYNQLFNTPSVPMGVNKYLVGTLGRLWQSNNIDMTQGLLGMKGNDGVGTYNAGVHGFISGQSSSIETIVAAGFFSNALNTNPNQWAVYAQGKGFSTVSWAPSDKAFKKNIEPLQNVLSDVSKLNLYSYYFDTTHKNASLLGLASSPEKQYGVISQELETVFPDMVMIDGAGNKLVKYDALIPVALKAIQEQQTQIEEEQRKIKTQQTEIDILKTQNAEFIKRLEALEKK